MKLEINSTNIFVFSSFSFIGIDARKCHTKKGQQLKVRIDL